MKLPGIKLFVLYFILSLFVLSAAVALVITYYGYLPTIAKVPLDKSDAWLSVEFYKIARNAFWIAGVSGCVLGFGLPVLFKIYKKVNCKNDA